MVLPIEARAGNVPGLRTNRVTTRLGRENRFLCVDPVNHGGTPAVGHAFHDSSVIDEDAIVTRSGAPSSPVAFPSDSRSSAQQRLWEGLRRDPMRAVLVGLILAAVLGVIGAVAGRGGSTTYMSQTVMLIDDPYGLAVQGNFNSFMQLSALRFKYADLINTSPIAQPVATSLHLPVASVVGSVSAEVPAESLLLDIDATWSTPREAQVLSQAVADELTNYVKAEDANFNIPAPSAFTLTTVDAASAAVSHGPSSRKTLTLAIGLAVLGFAVGLFATQFIRYYR